MVVKSDITINERLCLKDGLRLVKTNAFRFDNGKEIFRPGTVVWVGPWGNAVLCS